MQEGICNRWGENMSGIQICGTGRCLPENIVDNNEYARIVDTSDEWIRPRTGIVSIG